MEEYSRSSSGPNRVENMTWEADLKFIRKILQIPWGEVPLDLLFLLDVYDFMLLVTYPLFIS